MTIVGRNGAWKFGLSMGTVLAVASGGLGCGATAEDADVGGDEVTSVAAALSGPHVVETPPSDVLVEDSYFVTFFAYQTGINNPLVRVNSHTMAQFVHVVPDGQGGVSVDPSEMVTISWMPRAGVVRPFGGPEVGENTDLDFELGRGAGVPRARAAGWGPFRTTKTVWDRAVRQRDLLASGRVLYRAVGRDLVPGNEDYLADDGTPAPSAFNCMAAVSDVTPGGGIRLFIQSGIQGTQQVVDAFGPNVLDRPLRGVRVHDRHRWLALRTQLSRFNPLFRNGLELFEASK